MNINLTDEQLWDAVVGSGAFTFGSEWYTSASEVDHPTVLDELHVILNPREGT